MLGLSAVILKRKKMESGLDKLCKEWRGYTITWEQRSLKWVGDVIFYGCIEKNYEAGTVDITPKDDGLWTMRHLDLKGEEIKRFHGKLLECFISARESLTEAAEA